MKQTVVIISGWAHGLEAIRPMGAALAPQFNVQLLTGSQVLRDQKIPEADYIVTGSMGGLLAMELLPARCQKLVLLSSTAKFCAAEDYACGTSEKVLKRMLRMLKRNPDAVLQDFFKNVHFPHTFASVRRERQNTKEKGLQSSSHTSASVQEPLASLVTGLEYLLASDVRATVPTLKIPVHLFHGEADRIIPKSAADWLHAHLPDSRLTLFEDEGHALPAYHFTAIMDEISSFLELH
ncbi:MAG: alpha/beta hydrolase [Pontiella sp.]